eukprot:2563873-Pyramimonas_sp.AAC.1
MSLSSATEDILVQRIVKYQKVPAEVPTGPSKPPPDYGDLVDEIQALLEDFRHPSGKGFRVPAGDGEKAILQAALDRIYPAWTDRSHCEFWHLFCAELGTLALTPGTQDFFVQAVECWVPILGELFDSYVKKERKEATVRWENWCEEALAGGAKRGHSSTKVSGGGVEDTVKHPDGARSSAFGLRFQEQHDIWSKAWGAHEPRVQLLDPLDTNYWIPPGPSRD